MLAGFRRIFTTPPAGSRGTSLVSPFDATLLFRVSDTCCHLPGIPHGWRMIRVRRSRNAGATANDAEASA